MPKSRQSKKLSSEACEPGNGTSTPSVKHKGQRKTQYRFNSISDLALIMEFENFKPFLEIGKLATELWKAVADAVNSAVSAQIGHVRAKRRFELLLADFKKEDFQNRYKSGTEEDVTSIKIKLGLLQQLMEESKLVDEVPVVVLEDSENSDKKEKKLDDKAIGEEIRNAAETTFKRKSLGSPNGEGHSRPSKRNCVDDGLMELWKEKQDLDREAEDRRQNLKVEQDKLELEYKKDQLTHEKEKLEFEKVKFSQELEIRKIETEQQNQRLSMDKEERTAMIKTQEALIQLLVKMQK